MKKWKTKEIVLSLKCIISTLEGPLHEFKHMASLVEFVNKLKADTTVWKEFSEDQEDGKEDRLN
uniref:Uncharacterized protein n=1 Tax=Romanomermis culicivorax TaxID=13658 RepID=A0A915HIU8_ROMCU